MRHRRPAAPPGRRARPGAGPPLRRRRGQRRPRVLRGGGLPASSACWTCSPTTRAPASSSSGRPGSIVEELLADGPLADVESWRVTLETARALAAAQARGLRHGALTPRWVLRGDGGRVRVLGLCVAAALARDRRGRTGGARPRLRRAGSGTAAVRRADGALAGRPGGLSRCPRPRCRAAARCGPAWCGRVSRRCWTTSRPAPWGWAGTPALTTAAEVVAELEAAGRRMRGLRRLRAGRAGRRAARGPDRHRVRRARQRRARRAGERARTDRPGAGIGARWSGWLAGIVAAALVAGGLWLVARPDTTPTAGAQSSRSSAPSSSTASSAAPTGAIVPIVAVKDFDPRRATAPRTPPRSRSPGTATRAPPGTRSRTSTGPTSAASSPGWACWSTWAARRRWGPYGFGCVGHGTSVELRGGRAARHRPRRLHLPVAQASSTRARS